MRIIAGEFRRRRLLVSPGQTTRPITDRVKETLFELIQHLLIGQRVADVFAGTGSLGLEALSRGAKSVVFLESDRVAFDLLQQNVAALRIEDRTLCWRTDAVKSSFRPKGVDEFRPFDVVFFDPPYQMSARLAPDGPLYAALLRLAREGTTSESARLFYRIAERTALNLPPCWRHEATHAISSMEIHEFCKTARS